MKNYTVIQATFFVFCKKPQFFYYMIIFFCFWCKDVGVANVGVVDVGVDGVNVGVVECWCKWWCGWL